MCLSLSCHMLIGFQCSIHSNMHTCVQAHTHIHMWTTLHTDTHSNQREWDRETCVSVCAGLPADTTRYIFCQQPGTFFTISLETSLNSCRYLNNLSNKKSKTKHNNVFFSCLALGASEFVSVARGLGNWRIVFLCLTAMNACRCTLPYVILGQCLSVVMMSC